MPDMNNLHDSVVWLVSGAGMVVYATWLSIFLEHLRNPNDETKYSPWMQKLSAWVETLSSLQMQTLSWVAFGVPLLIVYLIVLFVPVEWYALVEPHFRVLVLALLAYSGQQWLHLRSR
jgi:hypothetical protein